MPGLEPGDRRCKSRRADQFQMLPWPNISDLGLLNGTMQVGLQFAIAYQLPWGIQIARLGKPILPAAPLPGGVKGARRPVKPFGVGASPTLAATQWLIVRS